MNATAAVATHLNLAQELILEIQEWASVLWVRIWGMRPRFVSKKVTKKMPEKINQDQLADQADELARELSDALPMGHCVPWDKLWDVATDILEGEITFEAAVERLTSKKIILKRG